MVSCKQVLSGTAVYVVLSLCGQASFAACSITTLLVGMACIKAVDIGMIECLRWSWKFSQDHLALFIQHVLYSGLKMLFCCLCSLVAAVWLSHLMYYTIVFVWFV